MHLPGALLLLVRFNFRFPHQLLQPRDHAFEFYRHLKVSGSFGLDRLQLPLNLWQHIAPRLGQIILRLLQYPGFR